MTTLPGSLLTKLARTCIAAQRTGQLLEGSLPLLVDLAGAHTILVLPPGGDGVFAHQAGVALPQTTIEVRDTAGLEALPVPAAWAQLGVNGALAVHLFGGAGVLVSTWSDPAPPAEWLEAGLAVVQAGLERIAAVDNLADLTERVNGAQQLANMGDYDWHIATDTNRWSDQLYRIYGHEPQSFNASYERFLSHIHPGDRQRITEIHQTAYATGEPYQMVERVVRPDGETRYLSSNGRVIMDESGTPVRMRGTCIDITDRVLAEQARERSAARFVALVESAPDAIIVLDGTGTIVQSNGRAADLLGGDPTGHAIDEILPLEGASGAGVEARGVDGRSLRLDVALAELNEPDGEKLIAAFLHDASMRIAAEALAASLREAQVRRRQALEINDNVVQGLAAAVYALEQDKASLCASYLERTLSSAKAMMNDLLTPITGEDLQPGDLVRTTPSALGAEVIPFATGRSAAAGASPKRRVLLVDDNADVRGLIRMQLETVGNIVVVGEASDGEEAVELAAELQPDIVLLDLAMPRMDGLQALPLIHEAVAGVEVIILSGFDQGSMADKALAAGAARYIEKGLRMNLADVIEDVLRIA